jgi:hypothetical protein
LRHSQTSSEQSRVLLQMGVGGMQACILSRLAVPVQPADTRVGLPHGLRARWQPRCLRAPCQLLIRLLYGKHT